MFDQSPPEPLRTDLPIKGIVLFAVGIGLSFGLCGVSVVFGVIGSMSVIVNGVFVLSVLGLSGCVLWLIVARIVNFFRR